MVTLLIRPPKKRLELPIFPGHEESDNERDSVLDKKEKLLAEQQEQLEKEWQKVRKRAAELEDFEITLEKREDDLKRLKRETADAESAKAPLLKEREKLERALETLNTEQDRVDHALAGKKEELARLDKDIKAQAQRIKEQEVELAKRFANFDKLQHSTNQREGELHSREEAVHQKEASTTERERKLNESTAKLDDRERSLAQREIIWARHEGDIKTEADALAKQRDEMEDMVKERQRELSRVQADWVVAVKQLEQMRGEWRAEKFKVSRIVQGDMAVLSEKEDELIKSVKELERDRKKLEQEEDAIMQKVRDMERVQKSFASEQARIAKLHDAVNDRAMKLDLREKQLSVATKRIDGDRRSVQEAMTKLRRVKELRENTAVLERHLNQIHAEIKHAESRMLSLGVRPKVQMPERPAAKPVTMKAEKPAKAAKPSIEPLAVIHEARQQLHAGNLAKARELIEDVQGYYDSMRDSDEKRMLGYDLTGLKTDLKLALLA